LIQDAGSQYWPAFIVARTWIIVILMGVGIQVVRWSIKKAGYLSSIFFISFLLILGCTYFVHSEWRYLLSLSVFLILWFGVQSFEWINKNIFSRAIVGLLISFFIVAGIFTAWNYQNEYHYFPSSSNEVPEMQKITKIIEFLKASGVRYVFSLEDDLSWKITYFSKEEILSRWANVHGRQPVYIKAIDQALLNGQRVAVVGNMLGELPAYLIIANDGVPTVVADPYFVYLDPSPVLVMYKLGFQVQRP